MPLHLTKVAVSCPSVAHLVKRQESRIQARPDGSLSVICETRFAPKRADELAGGSLYWIVKHTIAARQTILDIEMVGTGRGSRCHIHLAPEVVPVLAAPLRAHQGWRYLEAAHVPPDLANVDGDVGALPVKLMRELRALSLL